MSQLNAVDVRGMGREGVRTRRAMSREGVVSATVCGEAKGKGRRSRSGGSTQCKLIPCRLTGSSGCGRGGGGRARVDG